MKEIPALLKPQNKKPAGKCLWCNAPIDKASGWCPESDCKEQWELERQFNVRHQGRTGR